MGVIVASSQWLNHWDGIPTQCWHATGERSVERKRVLMLLAGLGEETDRGGYVLRGAIGTGKRELLRTAFNQRSSGTGPLWVSGSRYGSEIPYGAIHFLLTRLEHEQLQSPLAVYGHLRQHFTGLGTRPVIVLEHVDLIDTLTSAVLAQLVSTGVIKLVIIDDILTELSQDISALIRNGVLEVLNLGALRLREARLQVAESVEGDVSFLTAAHLWMHTSGCSEALDAVLLDCRQANSFEFGADVVALRKGAIPHLTNVEQHMVARLGRLNRRERQFLDFVAQRGAVPFGHDLWVHDVDVDHLVASGLLTEQEGSFAIASPAIARSLSGSVPGYSPLQPAGSSGAGARPDHLVQTHTSELHQAWRASKSEAQRSSAEAKWSRAIDSVKSFRQGHQDRTMTEGQREQTDLNESTLMLLRLLLAASRLEEAAALIDELQPEASHGVWIALDPCQKHEALALVAEYHSRINDFEIANELIDSLWRHLDVQHAGNATGYRLAPCMAETIRAMLNCSLALGRWEQSRHLIELILDGALPDLELIAYAEAMQAIIFALAGNLTQAQKAIVPLQQQLRESGTELERLYVDAVSQYISGRSGRETLGAGAQWKTINMDLGAASAFDCLWQCLHAVQAVQPGQASHGIEAVQAWARRAEAQGEILLASHLLGLLIRNGQFEVADRLLDLQHGQRHQLAESFRLLAQGAQNRDAQLLAAAVGALAALGFVSYATDDGAEIFRHMNASQRRQAARKAHKFMLSLQAERISPKAFANLGSLTVLTEREKFVASAAASGLSNLEIAEQASVSVRTVEGHLYQVYSKLGIRKRTDLHALTELKHDLNAAG